MFGQRSTGLDALLHRPRPSPWQEFFRAPCLFLARILYTRSRPIPPSRPANPISIVCISDTHNTQPILPDGDILIHAGDLTQSGTLPELQAALAWLRTQPHPHKLVIAGNHDLLLDPPRDPTNARAQLDWGTITYLHDSAATVSVRGRTLRVYGSPRSPRHGNWAFQYARADDVWAGTVPAGVDLLVTHAPPAGHLDVGLGCRHLLRELWRVRPAVHVFGHVHAGYGVEGVGFDGLQEACERVEMGGGGLWNLMMEVGELARRWWRPLGRVTCQLVNASAVGGLRDEERREAVMVYI